MVASASVKAEHGIVAEGEGKTGLAVPVDKGAALTVANLTVSDKYNYSLKLVVDGTVVKNLPYTLQENGTAAVTLGQLMADVLTELPAAYTVELTAEDKNPADAAVYLGKTIAVLTVAA